MCTAYADDSKFFLRDILSVKELTNQFYHFSGLKANIGKCEIVGIGFLKRVTEAVCGLIIVYLALITNVLKATVKELQKIRKKKKKIMAKLNVLK